MSNRLLREVTLSDGMLDGLDMTAKEALILLWHRLEGEQSIEDCLRSLHSRNMLLMDVSSYSITSEGIQTTEVLLEGNVGECRTDDVERLTCIMQQIAEANKVPSNKKSSKIDIQRAMRRFICVYGLPKEDTFHQAVYKYMHSFQYDYTYMKSLPRFILSIDNGYLTSELETHIELIEEDNDKD